MNRLPTRVLPESFYNHWNMFPHHHIIEEEDDDMEFNQKEKVIAHILQLVWRFLNEQEQYTSILKIPLV